MKLNKESFVEFLKNISLNGFIENKEALFVLGSEMQVFCVSDNSAFALHGVYHDVTIETPMSIGIDNIKMFSALINAFDSEFVVLEVNGNKLLIKSDDDALSVEYTLKNPDYILNKLEPTKFSTILKKATGNEFICKQEVINALIKTGKLLKTEALSINGKDTKLTLLFTDDRDNKVKKSFEVTSIKKEFNIKISPSMLDILMTAKNGAMISVLENNPLLVSIEEEKRYNIMYVLAQLKK